MKHSNIRTKPTWCHESAHRTALAVCLCSGFVLAHAQAPTPAPTSARKPSQELHHHLSIVPGTSKPVALTLDACSGRFDAELIGFLVQKRIPATLFVTKRWLDKNSAGVALLRQHLDLFDIENHGARHIPAVIGAGATVYGIAGHADVAQLRSEVAGGAAAITQAFGTAPRWYRAATARYDATAQIEIAKMGYQIAGFSINADAGATLKRRAVAARVAQAQGGDIIIAHMNHPESDTAQGLIDALTQLQHAGVVFVRLDQAGVQ